MINFSVGLKIFLKTLGKNRSRLFSFFVFCFLGFFLVYLLFIYSAELGLSCSTRDLHCFTKQHAGYRVQGFQQLQSTGLVALRHVGS